MNDEIIVVDKPSAFDKLKEKSMGNLAETLDSRTMIWLLFDVSISMASFMQRYALIDKFDWTVDTLALARKQLQVSGLVKYDAKNDDEVKQAVIDGVLAVQAPSKRHDADALSKVSRLDVAKKCTKLFVQRCFAKYPWFKVAVASFSGITLDMQASTKTSDARLDCACEVEQKTCGTIDALQNRGGTYIFGALHYMLETCKLATKSPAGHRVVLISDGHDISAFILPSLVAPYVKNKIVCDAVFIVPTTAQDPRSRPDGRAIIEFVKATGGECEFVDGESSFERKFLKVAARKLLTDGGK